MLVSVSTLGVYDGATGRFVSKFKFSRKPRTTAALGLTKLQLRNLYKFLSLRLLLPFFFSYIELVFLYVTVFVRKKTAQKQKFV